jgi:hypothetical protein
MTPGQLNEAKVALMIKQEIEYYDVKQEKRHKENAGRLEIIIEEQGKVSRMLATEKGEARGRAQANRYLMAAAAAIGSAVMAVVVELVKKGLGMH